MQLLAISGSLRTHSSNTALLMRAVAITPVPIAMWQGLASLPPFDPDCADVAPMEVRALRHIVAASSGMLISSPEYAHGVAGALKNALDWLVGSGEVYGKPTAVINVSARANLAQAALAETLKVMGASPLIDVVIPATAEESASGTIDAALRSLLDQLIRGICPGVI